jgi:putative transposase
MLAVEELTPLIGTRAACEVLGIPRSSVYRARQTATRPKPAIAQPRPTPARALSEAERAAVLDLLNGERFQNQAPREVYATLLDEEQYLCSIRSMYRILHASDEVRERRNQLRHPAYAKPELLATGPCQVWSWDITKLRGPQKGHYCYLYVMLDIFSRYVVGWMIAEVESAELAEQLIAETCANQGVQRAQLTIHADNGAPMTAKLVAVLMADLGVAKSHSRPHTSNDNPYSEAHFKTLKYRPDYPERFGGVADARAWAARFFSWYNHEHHHSGLALLTPFDVHYGWTELVLAKRQTVLQRFYADHPERFVKGAPVPSRPPEAAWINPPKAADQTLPANSASAVPAA